MTSEARPQVERKNISPDLEPGLPEDRGTEWASHHKPPRPCRTCQQQALRMAREASSQLPSTWGAGWGAPGETVVHPPASSIFINATNIWPGKIRHLVNCQGAELGWAGSSGRLGRAWQGSHHHLPSVPTQGSPSK